MHNTVTSHATHGLGTMNPGRGARAEIHSPNLTRDRPPVRRPPLKARSGGAGGRHPAGVGVKREDNAEAWIRGLSDVARACAAYQAIRVVESCAGPG